MIKFRCHHCGKDINAPDQHAGKKAKCPGCKEVLVIPTGLGLHPTAMDLVFVSAFTAAVVGGLDSPLGAVVGGLVVGLVLATPRGTITLGTAPMSAAKCVRRCVLRVKVVSGETVKLVGINSTRPSLKLIRPGRALPKMPNLL